MITTINFNKEELSIIEFSKKDIKTYVAIFLKIFLPLSFLLGLFGFLKREIGYWPTTLFFLLVYLFVTVYLIIKEHIIFSRDIKERLKYVGTIRVRKKSRIQTDCKIYTDSKEIDKIDVHLVSIFNQIEIGDELYLEIAKSSKYIFKLSKGELPLIIGC